MARRRMHLSSGRLSPSDANSRGGQGDRNKSARDYAADAVAVRCSSRHHFARSLAASCRSHTHPLLSCAVHRAVGPVAVERVMQERLRLRPIRYDVNALVSIQLDARLTSRFWELRTERLADVRRYLDQISTERDEALARLRTLVQTEAQ